MACRLADMLFMPRRKMLKPPTTIKSTSISIENFISKIS
jgi:hypothetical protein